MVDEEATLQEEEKITIFSAGNNDVLVWNANDVFTLRTKYCIVGSLIGSLPRKPKQNIYLSLPLLLSKDETTLLLEKNVARLVESSSNPPLPSHEEVEMFARLRKESLQEQIQLFDLENEEKEKEIQSIIEGERKPKKRKAKKRRMKDCGDGGKPEKIQKAEESRDTSEAFNRGENLEKMDLERNQDNSLHEVPLLQNDSKKSNDKVTLGEGNNPNCITQDSVGTQANLVGSGDTKQLKNLPQQNHKEKQQTSETSRSTDGLSYLQECKLSSGDFEMNSNTMQENFSVGLSQEEREKGCVIQIPTNMPTCKTNDFPEMQWGYPVTKIEQIKFKVYKDLWERGYYITSGTKYSGDFLVYLGDPFKFHSSYVVMVMEPSRKFNMLEMISIGRLAATVKKTAVLATIGDNDDVIYSSVKWSGIS